MSQGTLWGTMGGQRRDQGIKQRVKRDPHFHEQALKAIRILARTGQDFTADEVQELLAAADVTPTHPNSMGAAFNAARHAGIIRRTGYRKSTRPAANARAIAVYVGVR